MKSCEHCNRHSSYTVFRIILLSLIVFHQCIHVASSENISVETREEYDLLDEQDFIQLTRKFRRVPISEIEAAFEELFSEDDWVWTFMTYSDDVRSAWVKQLSSYLTGKPETKKKRHWNLHCIDAHAMCQINTKCANLYSDVIDACNLNRARIFGEADSPESLAFAAKQSKIKTAARRSRRVRKKKCRSYFKQRMTASRPRGPLLIGRSANRPQLITHQRPTTKIRPKLVAGLKKWIKARRRKMKMSQRHIPTMEEVMSKMRYWGGKQHASVHALMCENLEETCPSTCFESLKRMNASIYSPLLLKCECKFSNLPRNLSNRVESLGFSRPSNLWDEKMCRVQKRLVDNCRPKVYRTLPARRPGCTVVLVKCRKNRVCFRAYREVNQHCAGAIEGRGKCPLNCTAAMAELYAKAPSFFRCRPDGLKRPLWMKWHRNMGRSCNLKCAAQSEGYNDALTKC